MSISIQPSRHSGSRDAKLTQYSLRLIALKPMQSERHPHMEVGTQNWIASRCSQENVNDGF
jgi:hypothetical protein